VPWSKLGTEPVVAEFDRLYLVASPREDDTGTGSCPQNVADAIAAAQAAEQAAKRQQVDAAEDTWLKVGLRSAAGLCIPRLGHGAVRLVRASASAVPS
jgi:hypothetical protein